ncbi:MAG: dipeptidase [Cyclobacteriaceae bacterium]|nr:dipeptidase [Cyclobacteriaceae bacterium]
MQFLKLLTISVLLMSCMGGSSTEQSQSDTMDSLALSQKAQELAQKYIITDGHIDVPYRLNTHMEDVSVRTERGDFDFERAKAGGLNAPFMSIFVPASYQETGGARVFADSMIQIVEGMASNSPHKFAIARSPQDVEEIVARGLIALPMGMENGAPLEEDLSNVQYFFDRGIRYITLTHGRDNLICDSSYDTTRTWNGLSPYGYNVVEEMNKVGIMIDVSHISDSTFYQVMRASKAPAIASHSSCRYFTPGWERNMADDMIQELAVNGGVIQINFGSTFLDQASNESSKAIQEHVDQWKTSQDVEPEDAAVRAYRDQYRRQHFKYSHVARVVDHIDHVVELAGIDHVAFGSDFDGVGDSLPVGLKDVSQYPNLIFELLKRGYSEEDIEKICYKNVFRVWSQVTEVAKELQKSSS